MGEMKKTNLLRKLFAITMAMLVVVLYSMPMTAFAGQNKIKIHNNTESSYGSSFILYDSYEKAVAGVSEIGTFTSQGNYYEDKGNSAEGIQGDKVLVSDGVMYNVNISNHGEGNKHDASGATDNYWIIGSAVISPIIISKSVTGPEGDPNLSGWSFNFSLTSESGYAKTFSLSESESSITMYLAPGTYTLVEAPAEGWTSSIPESGLTVTVDKNGVVTTGSTISVVNTINSPVVPGQGTFSVPISKEVSAVEGSVAPDNWEFEFTLSNSSDYSSTITLTDSSNSNSFKNVSPGEYTLTETPCENWESSISRGAHVTVTENGEIVYVDADGKAITSKIVNTYTYIEPEDTPTYSVEFTKKIAGESFTGEKAGFNFVLTKAGAEQGSSQYVVFSKGESEKTVTFTGIEAGTYTLTEEAVSGWSSSLPSEGITVTVSEAGVVAFGNDGASSLTVTNTYQNEEPSTFTVGFEKKIEGIPEGIEVSTEDRTFRFVLSNTDNTFEQTVTVSELSAGFSFVNVPAGIYTLSETPNNLWTSSIPAGMTVTVNEDGTVIYGSVGNNNVITNTYQNEEPSTFTVGFEKKIEGIPEGIEVSTEDRTFRFVLSNTDNTFEQTVTVSELSAGFSFVNVPAGIYTLSETPNNLWTSSIPAGMTVTVNEDGTVIYGSVGNNNVITNTYKQPELPPTPPGPLGPIGPVINPDGPVIDPDGPGYIPTDEPGSGDGDGTIDVDPAGDEEIIDDEKDAPSAMGDAQAEPENRGVQTGDVTDMYLWLTIFGAALVSAAAVAGTSRRRNEN